MRSDEFPSPRLRIRGARIADLPGSRDNLEKEIHTDGKIRPVDERGAGFLDTIANLREVIVPAGGTRDRADTEGGKTKNVFGGGGRSGEFDRGGRSRESFAGECGGVGTREASNDVEAVLRSELLDEATHFAVADDGEKGRLIGVTLRW